jgi:hypothetical protein
MFNKINETQLLREIAELKNEVASLKEQQIKSRRDENDRMYNLDSDNIPSLNGIVKEIRLIVQDGAVSGALIIQAINSTESEAQILASHINLSGMTINLNAGEGITITSPNFSVTKEGNMTCQNAEIKKSCALATDLGNVEEGEENGMLIGPIQETEEYIAETRLLVTRDEDGPGIRFRSKYYDKSDKNEYVTDLVMTGKKVKMVGHSTYKGLLTETAAVGVNLEVLSESETQTRAVPRAFMVNYSGAGVWTHSSGTGSELRYSGGDGGTGEVVETKWTNDLQKETYPGEGVED